MQDPDITIVDLGQRSVRPLTPDPAESAFDVRGSAASTLDAHPVWVSRAEFVFQRAEDSFLEGSSLVRMSAREPEPIQIAPMNLPGLTPTSMAFAPAGEQLDAVALAPDGSKILLAVFSPDRGPRLLVRDLYDGRAQELVALDRRVGTGADLNGWSGLQWAHNDLVLVLHGPRGGQLIEIR